MSAIISVDFKNRRVLATKPVASVPLLAVYKRIAAFVERPGRILEAVGTPMDINIQSIFPAAQITRWAYSHDSKPELARRYLTLIPPNADYDLIIATHLIEEWADMPFVMLHQFPGLLLKALDTGVCILHDDCPAPIMAYVRITMSLAFNEITEFTEEGIIAIMGRGLR